MLLTNTMFNIFESNEHNMVGGGTAPLCLQFRWRKSVCVVGLGVWCVRTDCVHRGHYNDHRYLMAFLVD